MKSWVSFARAAAARAVALLAVVGSGVVGGSVVAAAAQQQPEDGLPSVEGWSIAAPLLAPSSEQAVASVGNLVYLLGGYPPGRIPVDSVQVYDTLTDRWRYGPSLPDPAHHIMAASVGGTLFAIGGETGDAGTGQPDVYLSNVYRLDPGVADWAPVAAMPTSRSAGGTAVIDSKIYVAGGRPPHGSDFAAYDPAANAWQVLPDLPTQRNHLAVAAIGGKVYVAGGRFGGGFDSERTAVLEIFDPASGAWSAGPFMPTPRGGVAGVEANGCLFVIGGEGNYADPRGLFTQNEAFNPQTNSWVSLPPMPTPTHGLVGAAFVGGLIHIPGGSVTMGGGTGSAIHQVYRPSLSCQ